MVNTLSADGTVNVVFYMEKGEKTPSVLAKLQGFLWFFAIQIAAVICLTRLKYKRIREQKETYEKIKELQEDHGLEVSYDF